MSTETWYEFEVLRSPGHGFSDWWEPLFEDFSSELRKALDVAGALKVLISVKKEHPGRQVRVVKVQRTVVDLEAGS